MAISPLKFYDSLNKNGIEFFSGVPDSLLKQFCFCIDDNIPKSRHIITANEGNAIAIAAGYHLATNGIPLVYMQNSGLGNSINPLLSLCDPEVYSIPMLLLIGWRGEPGVFDEPQHIKQGKVQLDLLNAMDIPYTLLSKDEKEIEKKITKCILKAKEQGTPFAIIVKKGTFDNYKHARSKLDDSLLTREKALDIILKHLPIDSIIVSTTGKTSREIFEIRELNGESHHRDFLTVGSMGHTSSIALGIAISNPDRQIVCIDGDGSLIMHMGSLATIGEQSPENFIHLLINNHAHDSVGGQPTSAKHIDMQSLAKSNNYKNVKSSDEPDGIKNNLHSLLSRKGPNFLEVVVKTGSRKDLGRPTTRPIDNKKEFMKNLNKGQKL